MASTLLIGTLLAPTPSVAQTTTCSGGPAPGPTPILEIAAASIICVNNDDRVSNGDLPDAIALETNGDDHFIDLDNSGDLTATDDGIDAVTDGARSFITIENSGDINAGGYGIVAGTVGTENSGVTIDNSGDIVAGGALGIYATTSGNAAGPAGNAGVVIDNSGDVSADLRGIQAHTEGQAYGANSNAGIVIDNSGDLAAFTGIYARTAGHVGSAGGQSPYARAMPLTPARFAMLPKLVTVWRQRLQQYGRRPVQFRHVGQSRRRQSSHQ